MKITYIHHSSFMVELDQAAFLFDYFQGTVPKITGKPLIVFASHRHGDHFSPAIFDLAGGDTQVRYVISDDIWRKRVPAHLQEQTLFLGPEKEARLDLPWPVSVRTYRSTDEGVAFIVECGQIRLYHGGDLNNWYWSGESQAYNEKMEKAYRRELQLMAGIHLDVAFVPLDPRQEQDFYRGMDDFMRIVGADRVFPMHCWGDFSVIPRLKAMEISQPYRDRIMEIHQDGEVFEL